MAPKKSIKTAGDSGKGRFILMIGDEGGILIQIQKRKVVRRLFAQSPDPGHVRGFEEALNSMPKAPITLLVDMMDQSYIRQTLPPVSSLSVGKIVKRRLDKDFSPDDIKGYIILNREKTGRKDWNYLMVSLANSALLQKWIGFVVERPNPFKGIGLVPLEAQSFIAAAEKAMLKSKDDKPLEWQILVNHHKVGGFRQIVLRKGRLIFTRMAQPIGESLPDVIAGNIEQEMTNTLEYLKRLGLSDPSILSVIVVASEDIKQAIDPKNIKAGQYHFFTPHEIAVLLSIGDAAQPEDHFADVVIASFIAKQRKLILSLTTKYTKKLQAFTTYILGLRAVGMVALLCILGWMAMSGYDVYSAKQQTQQLEAQHKSLLLSLAALKAKSSSLPKQINIYTDVVGMSRLFDKRIYDPLDFVKNFSTTLQDTALANSFAWKLSDALSVTKDSDKRQIQAEVDLRLLLPHEPHDKFINSTLALVDRIKNTFSNFDTTHSELPGLLSDSKELKTVIGDNGAASESTGTNLVDTIKIDIKGPKDQEGKNGK
jgi:hypothetical protein